MSITAFSRTLENGSRVYDWNVETWPSVTSIIKNGLAKPGLIDWAARQVAKDAADNFEEFSLNTSKKSRYEWLWGRFSNGRNGNGRVGDIVHGHADDIAKGYDIPENAYTEEVLPFMDTFHRFIKDWQPRYIESEAFVASRQYGYAGTLDAIVEINGVQYVLDIKTGNSVWPEVGLQLAAYARADFIGREFGVEAELPVLHPKRGLVLHLRPDKYTLRPVRIDDEVFDAFLACIDMHHYQTTTQHFILGTPWEANNG